MLAELLWHGFAGFFAAHSIEAGFVSGVLLSLVVAFFVERILVVTRLAKWESVSVAAFEALAYEVGIVIDALNNLVAGEADANALGHEGYVQRLRGRLRDLEWSRDARMEIEVRRVFYRNALGLWAGALVATGELSDVLKRVASLNVDLSALEEWIRIRNGGGGFTKLGWTEDGIVEVWLIVLAEALSLREDLWREAKQSTDPAWFSFRNPVTPEHLLLMQARENRSRRRVHERLVEPPPHPARLAGI